MEDFTVYNNIDDLDNESKYLVHKAKEATAHAYAPYSKFLVGAALILDDGTVVTGGNQENAAYPLCMCAERVAFYATAAVHPGRKILKIAIVAHKKNRKELVSATSCGACRQVMHEFETRQDKDIVVIMMGPDNKWYECKSVASLLPFAFDKRALQS